jgi:hypothetical protein
MTQENHKFTGLMMREDEQEVLEDIANTTQGIPLGENIVAQVHLLLGNIRGDLWWMRYKEK